jgi:hypothetical protein
VPTNTPSRPSVNLWFNTRLFLTIALREEQAKPRVEVALV